MALAALGACWFGGSGAAVGWGWRYLLGDLPLAVVTARQSFNAFAEAPIPLAASDQAWLALQRELAALSTRSVHLISETADHNITFADPALVIQAIQAVLAMSEQ